MSIFKDYVFDPTPLEYLNWHRKLIMIVRRIKKLLVLPLILSILVSFTILYAFENRILFRETINHAISFLDRIGMAISGWAEVGK